MPGALWDRRLFDTGQRVPLVGPCLFVFLVTLLFRFTDADLLISGLFYSPGSETAFPFAAHPLLLAIYYGGLIPAWVIGLCSLAVLAAGAFGKASPEQKRAAVFVLAVLIVGPILLVNVAYKGHWGRPRPNQTSHFGGERSFYPVLEKGPAGRYQSFPSGHASAGFCVMVPAFLLYRRHPRFASAWLMCGLACGAVVGLGRIMQGRHFASDVLWAAAIVYFTACAFDYLILGKARSVIRRPAVPFEAGPPDATIPRPRHDRAPHRQTVRRRREAA